MEQVDFLNKTNFNQSKSLYELGCNLKSDNAFDKDGYSICINDYDSLNDYKKNVCYYAPELELVKLWMFTRYGIFISINSLNDDFGVFYWTISKRYGDTNERLELASNFYDMNETHDGDSIQNTLSEAIDKAIEIISK